MDGIPVKVTDAEIEELAKLDLNARQIKNVLKIAHLVAQKRGNGLTWDIIQLAIGFNHWDLPPLIDQANDLI